MGAKVNARNTEYVNAKGEALRRLARLHPTEFAAILEQVYRERGLITRSQWLRGAQSNKPRKGP